MFDAFRAYCKRVGISEAEGVLGAVEILVPDGRMTDSRAVMHTVLEVRSFSPEILTAVFDLTHDGIECLMERANKVEHAHKLWGARNV